MMDLAAAITEYLTDLKARAVAAGKADPQSSLAARIHAYADGTGTVGPGVPLAAAFAEAEEWLTRDEIAELNATLGLTPDGRFMEAA